MTNEFQTGTVLLVAGSANFSTRDVWDGYRVALQEIGLQVIPYSTFSFLRLLSVDAVCNDIIGTAVDQDNRVDYAIFVDGLYFRGQRSRVPLSIRRAGIPTVLIATEDPYTTIPNTESLYTFRFTNERTCAARGIEYLPTATLPPPQLPRVRAPTYDVSFVGTVFEDRVDTLVAAAECCEQQRWRFLIAGKILGDARRFDRYAFTDVQIRTIDAAEKWRIYAESRVTLNVFRQSDSAESPNPRVFEVTAFGHATLVSGPRRKEVDQIYADQLHQFDSSADVGDVIMRALHDRAAKECQDEHPNATAKTITLRQHTYQNRVNELLRALRKPLGGSLSNDQLAAKTAWIIGCGRTGSTWLAEMLGDLPGIRRWHEPYFGRLLRHLHERPDELDRNASFFSRRHLTVWTSGLRELFYTVARDRFPQLDRHALVVKEVNTPEIYAWISELFPQSRLILLVRDPFDVLDSYLDLQRPGSWNQRFGGQDGHPLETQNVRRTAHHILTAMNAALTAYDGFPSGQRLWISYENLLRHPIEELNRGAQIVGVHPGEDALQNVVERHRFNRHKQTGPLEFRRQGKAQGWLRSSNFTGEVRQIANEVLGKLRSKLGYRSDVPAEETEDSR